jgi:hypothetical protein
MLWTPPNDGTLESWTEYLEETQQAAKDLREQAKTLPPRFAKDFREKAQLADEEAKTAREAIKIIKETPEGEIPLV